MSSHNLFIIGKPSAVPSVPPIPPSFNFTFAKAEGASSQKSEDDVSTAFTCSICLEFYKTPKNLPNCGHCYCLACLQSLLQREPNKHNITCPDCRAQSSVPFSEGLNGLKTNIQLQRGAEAFKKYSDKTSAFVAFAERHNSLNDKCPHQMYCNNNSVNCEHCNSKFCDRCQVVHCEVMKTEILERGSSLGTRVEVAVGGIEQHLEQVRNIVENNLKQLEAQVVEAVQGFESAVIARIAEEKAKMMDQARSFSKRQLEKIENLAKVIKDKQPQDAALCSQVTALTSKSVLKCSLPDVAKLHKKITDRDTEVKAIEKLKEPDGISSALGSVVFKPDDKLLKSVIDQFQLFNIGTVRETKLANRA